LLGVSHSTVSRRVSGDPVVQARIAAAAKREARRAREREIARLPMTSQACSATFVVKTSLKPSASYHCRSVMNQTIGLERKKMRMATPKSAAPTQKRRGGRGTRMSRAPSNGPPRSNGSNGL